MELLRIEFRCADEVLQRILDEKLECKYKREHYGELKVQAEGTAIERIHEIHMEERDKWLYGFQLALPQSYHIFTTKCDRHMQRYVVLCEHEVAMTREMQGYVGDSRVMCF